MIYRASKEAFQTVKQETTKTSISQHSNSKEEATRITGMTLQEALKILNIDNLSKSESELNQKFNHLFKINSSENGGTLYIQSKIFRAKERIEIENKNKKL